MPAKAKAPEKKKTKAKVPPKAKAASKARAQIPPRPDSADLKEANRVRQRNFVEKHREEINAKRRLLYAERKEAGRCPRCGKKLRSAKAVLCKACLEKAKEYNKK